MLRRQLLDSNGLLAKPAQGKIVFRVGIKRAWQDRVSLLSALEPAHSEFQGDIAETSPRLVTLRNHVFSHEAVGGDICLADAIA